MNKTVSFDGNKDLRILIIKPSSLGDVLHAFPAVSMIAEKYPGASIDWLVHPAFAPLLEYHPDIRNIIHFPRRELASAGTFFPAFFRLCSELRGNGYDMAVDLQGLFRSAFFAAVTGAAVRAGFAEPRERLSRFFYNFKVDVPPSYVHAIEKNIFLAASLTGQGFKVCDTELAVNEKNMASVSGLLRDAGIEDGETCVGIAPGARWESKRWPPEFFAEIINAAAESFPSMKFILTGSGEDLEISERILALTGNKRAVSLAGKTGMGELVELVRRCSAIVTNDSGPMHLAAALRVPVFAFFGPTAPERTGPYWKEHFVFQAPLDCIKCMKRYCSAARPYECHEKLRASDAAERIISFLREGAKHVQG